MSGTKDNDNRRVFHFRISERVTGLIVFLVGFGGACGLAQYLYHENPVGQTTIIVWSCLIFPVMLLGIWLMGYTSRVDFDPTSGTMTIRKSIWFLPYRTMRFSKRDVLAAWVGVSRWESEENNPAWGVWLKLAGRKKERKIVSQISLSNAEYLAESISNFIGS